MCTIFGDFSRPLLSTVSANLLRRAEQQTDRKKVAVRKQNVVTFFSRQMEGGQITRFIK